MMFDRHANLKYKFRNRHFWSKGYYVSIVGINEDTIRNYIKDKYWDFFVFPMTNYPFYATMDHIKRFIFQNIAL